MTAYTIHKLNEKGETVWSYPANLLEKGANFARLEAFFDHDFVDLGFATFKRGDRFIETYYEDRWYNVFAVYDGHDGDLQGWYCNICRPARIEDSTVSFEDLALDLWVTPRSEAHLLDLDEFESLDLDAGERQNCLLALQMLQNLAQQDRLPR
ncbi:MAG: DUF402 domain-containing protein [Candidatus Promineifilaceae bacterium]|nr:DUF402 domain-containing protein [Candidatus Promineifilaceae bacterium]